MRIYPRLLTIGALGAALMTAGCSQSKEVVGDEVNRSGLRIDFDECSDADCDTKVEAQPLEPAAAQGCESAQTRNATPDWMKYYGEDLLPCETGQCRLEWLRMAVAADGTLWVSASLRTENWDHNAGGVYLARYAEDGSFLGEQVVDFKVADRDIEVEYETRLAADSEGHVILAFNKSVGEVEGDQDRDCFLYEFGSDGTQIDEPDVLGGATIIEMAFDAEDNLYLLGYQDDRYEELSLAKVSLSPEDHQCLWVQSAVSGPNNSTNIDAFTIAPDGTVTTRGFRQGRITSEDGLVISHFDSDGSISWELKPTSMDSWINNEELGHDGQGNILRANYLDTAMLGEDAPPGIVPRFRLEKLNAAGKPVWAVEQPLHLDAEGLVAWVNPCNPVADTDGNIYVGSADILEDGEQHVVIRHVANDGSDCGVFVMDEYGLSSIETLALGPGGKLYFSGQHGFGVLDL